MLQWWPGYVERVVAPVEIQAIEGAYSVERLGLTAPRWFRIQSDANDRVDASTLALLENGRVLASGHARHAPIGTGATGDYRHWDDGLYLSSSDGSDPRTNGRHYVVRATLVPRRRLVWALAAALVFSMFGVLRSMAARMTAKINLAAVSRHSPSLETLLAGVPVVGLCVAAIGLAYVGFLSLLDPLGALELSRKAAIKLTMMGVWFAIGVVAAVGLQRRDLRSWRLGVALLTLFGTICFLYLRTEVYGGDRILPRGPAVFGPLAIGVLATYVVPLAAIRQWLEGFRARPDAGRRALTGTIVLVLCLAAPMIWSPVIQHWNSSGWMDSHGYDTYAHNILSGKIPEGSSAYMPVYQYGMAAVYYLFGHFFFVQQLFNVALAFLTVTLICLAAWNLFRNLWAVLLIGIWAAFARQMVYAVFFTQIESWYMPVFAFGIFAWTGYWRTPSKAHLVLLALAAGIGINTRNQGAFYFAWLCLAPLFIAALPWRRRFIHAAIAVTILAASLLPWSVRNYYVDGRLSPSSARNAVYMGILNDPRIGFYGVRYWEGWEEVTEDYVRRYPDPVERDRVMMRAGLRTPFDNFGWFARAMYWRALGFYGVLPPGILAPAGPEPTNWATDWRGFVYWRTTPLLLLPLSLLGLLTRPSLTTVFLAVAVAANVATTAMTGGAEDRVSYPVLLLHMLLALAALFPLASTRSEWSVVKVVSGAARPRTWAVAIAALLLFLGLSRAQFGRPNLYAPQVEPAVFMSPDVEVDATLPSLNDFASTSAKPPAPEPEWEGRSFRLRLMALNYQCPPKFGGRIGYMPDFATDPLSETYYYATLLVSRDGTVEHLPIAVAWRGATVNERLREGDEVEAEGRLRLANGNMVAPYWVHIEKARKVSVRSSAIPTFF